MQGAILLLGLAHFTPQSVIAFTKNIDLKDQNHNDPQQKSDSDNNYLTGKELNKKYENMSDNNETEILFKNDLDSDIVDHANNRALSKVVRVKKTPNSSEILKNVKRFFIKPGIKDEEAVQDETLKIVPIAKQFNASLRKGKLNRNNVERGRLANVLLDFVTTNKRFGGTSDHQEYKEIKVVPVNGTESRARIYTKSPIEDPKMLRKIFDKPAASNNALLKFLIKDYISRNPLLNGLETTTNPTTTTKLVHVTTQAETTTVATEAPYNKLNTPIINKDFDDLFPPYTVTLPPITNNGITLDPKVISVKMIDLNIALDSLADVIKAKILKDITVERPPISTTEAPRPVVYLPEKTNEKFLRLVKKLQRQLNFKVVFDNEVFKQDNSSAQPNGTVRRKREAEQHYTGYTLSKTTTDNVLYNGDENTKDIKQDLRENETILQTPRIISSVDAPDSIEEKINRRFYSYVKGSDIRNRESDNRSVIKAKILQFIDETIKDIKVRVDGIQNLQKFYAKDNSFQVGYTLSNINYLYSNLKSLHDSIKENNNAWDELTVMRVYEQLKDSHRTVTNLMSSLINYVRSEATKVPGDNKIAMAYYDDKDY